MLALSVHNEGNPIPEHELGLLFNRFYRTNEAKVSGKSGYGLGLVIVKGIAEAHHGGTVSVESNGAGRYDVYADDSDLETPGQIVIGSLTSESSDSRVATRCITGTGHIAASHVITLGCQSDKAQCESPGRCPGNLRARTVSPVRAR